MPQHFYRYVTESKPYIEEHTTNITYSYESGIQPKDVKAELIDNIGGRCEQLKSMFDVVFFLLAP